MSINELPVILLIEDDPVGTSSLLGVLGDTCELIIGKSLADARQLLNHDIDLILLHLYLPDGSGIEFLNDLKAQAGYESLPVMCILSSDCTRDIEQAFQHGATDYLLKPFNRTVVSEKIATLIDLKRKTDLLAAAALSDPLTQIGNRRLFDQQFNSEWRRTSRLGGFIGLILIDVDNFKQINEQFGHAVGDQCLQSLAHSIKTRFGRSGDVAARLGDDEFAVIVPGTNLAGTITAANSLLALLQRPPEPAADDIPALPVFTVSIGCWAMQPIHLSSYPELVALADQQLYQAREEGGRNCVRPIIDNA